MLNVRESSGVTLVALVTIIIVMLILASIVTYTGINSIKESEDYKLEADLEIVQHAVLEQYIRYTQTKSTNELIGEIDNETAKSVAQDMGITLIQIPENISNNPEYNYYKLSPSHLNKIGISSSKHTYIVNYATGEVMNESVHKLSTDKPLYIKAVTE